MENSTKKCGGAEIPKRNRSLDLKSLYESRLSKLGESKKKVSDGKDQEGVKKKKRKSRKELPLSCFEPDTKKCRKEGVNGVKSKLGSDQKSSGKSNGLNGVSLSLGDNGSSFNIPRRPRGSVRRRKLESDESSEPLRRPNSVAHLEAFKSEVIKAEAEAEAGPSEESVQLVTTSQCPDALSNSKSEVSGSDSKSVGKVSASNSKVKQKGSSKSTVNPSSPDVKLKRKIGADELKQSKNSRSSSVQHVVKEHKQVVNNGDTLPKRRQSDGRKKKDTVVGRDGGEVTTKKSEPCVNSSISNSLCTDFLDGDEDDEENLERNAARMLSSRFDPSCTGFSSKRKSSGSQTADGLSSRVSSARDSFSQQDKSLGGQEPESADDRSRALSPKSEDKGKGILKKRRRHFYEILPRDLDSYWVLNRRIKIFWPLDESWYYGLVNDYHSETKLHHIKYDDREEEWVDLREEKFKLLLLPGEVPDKAKSRRRSSGNKSSQTGQTGKPTGDDSCIGNCLDSETIASWLASQSQRVKALPKSSKRLKTSEKHMPLLPSLSSDNEDNSTNKVFNSKITRVEKSQLGTTRISQSDKHVVYVRKKYHKKRAGGASVFRDAKAYRSGPLAVTCVTPDSGSSLWSSNDKGELKLNLVLLESKALKFKICLPELLFLEYFTGIEVIWLLYDIFMLQNGVLVTTSPAVTLDILFIDSNLGLKHLLFEGCLKQALAFVFLILIVFGQSGVQWNGDMKLPVTSIRFQLSSVRDLSKQHIFAFYCFSRLQSSKWLYLDSKILPHCRVIEQLPVSDCTCDNIKELEHRSFQQCKPCDASDLSLMEGVQDKFGQGVLSMDVPSLAHSTKGSQPAFCLTAKPGRVPPIALSFSAAPSFFITQHLQLLVERSFSWAKLQHQDSLSSSQGLENGGQPVPEYAECEPISVAIGGVAVERDHEIKKLVKETPAFRGLSSYQQDLHMDVVLASNAAENSKSFVNLQKGNLDEDGTAGCFKKCAEVAPEVIAQQRACDSNNEMRESVSTTSPTSDPRIGSTLGGMIVDIPSFEQVDIPSDGKGCISRQPSDVGWTVHDVPTPNASKSSWKRGRSSSVASPHELHSPAWSDGKPNFIPSGFSHGPKKPRTQVQYTLPFVGYDLAKQTMPSSRSLPCKRIRRASLKKISDGSGKKQKNLELLTCVANVLVTHGDKGWRECGAQIVLEVADHNEWRLAVKFSGITKYSYKVKHILQPGSTNRYSHAMMWKGGKDWVLEFPDRSQWVLFKEMHEECYNRNIRAASVKNIPIPGVCVVEESEDCGAEVPFVRNPTKYFRQVQNDIEMALDPSHTLYDMDSDDEQWLRANKNCVDDHKYEEISEEILEKTIDMFEKLSYAQHCDSFTDAEIEDLVSGIGSVKAAKVIYDHWRRKREKMGMPLIRHLQPPLWERYQQQLKEWEQTVARGSFPSSIGSQEKKVLPPEKPPMFAFCLKPRGLEVPNKGSKQRSHRRFSVSGHHHASSGDHDNLLVFGRRSNGHAFGDEKVLYTSSIYDSSDVSPSFHPSPRVFSPRNAHFSLSNNDSPRFYKNKAKKLGSYYPALHYQQLMSHSPRTTANKNVGQNWNMGLNPYYHNRQKVEHLDSTHLQEFRLRDASSAAHHARNIAKLKRERAQRLLYRADLAIHKAVVALMTAEAMKDSSEKSSNGGNQNDKHDC